MRLSEIRRLRAELSTSIQEFSPSDISGHVFDSFRLVRKDSARRRLMRGVAEGALWLQRRRAERTAGFTVPFSHDAIAIGERFASDASTAALLKRVRRPRAVLVPGCYLGAEDVQFWLRRGVEVLEGIDVYSLASRWSTIVPALQNAYRCRVRFQQASIERLPFDDESFDVISSAAVVEHVRNLDAMVDETARVLRKSGWIRHDFGPLYYSFAGDHCMSAFGAGAGYDHLLLDEDEYQRRISDQPFFDTLSDPNLPFWARNRQFSFAEPLDYIRSFSRRFVLDHVVVRISDEGLRYRAAHPDRWRALLDASIPESSLLIKSLAVVMRRA
jgi:SAM-dependent methyltransferase